MNKKILAFITKKDRFLALKSNPHPEHGNGGWFTVTGSLEKDETLEDALIREVKEETNLNVNEIYDLKWGCCYNWKGEIQEERYFIVNVSEGKIILNEESIDYEWLNIDKFVERINWSGNKGELNSILELGLKKEIDYPYVRIDDYISKNTLKTHFIEKNSKTTLSWYEKGDFSNLKNVRQAYGMCFDKKNKLLILQNKKKWFLPGGKPEKGENFEQTLKREVMEEANIEIEEIIPIGYNLVETINQGEKYIFYQLRYAAKIKKILKQKIDPATKVKFKRKLIKPKDFVKYSLWGRPGERMINLALEKYLNIYN